MFINERLLYFELHKTGCSHVLKILSSIPNFKGRIVGKHNSIYDVPQPELGDLNTKIKIGNIRNPWDWYVSLWAFGCMKKGGLYEQLTNKRLINKLKKPKLLFKSSAQWISVYENAENPELFRNWLKMILQTNRKDIHEYKRLNENVKIGLLTTRYLHLYNHDFHKKAIELTHFDDIVNFDKIHNFLDVVLYNETLDADLFSLLTKLNIDQEILHQLITAPRTNASKRKSYQDYYNTETINLVSSMDRLIIEKHNYSF